MLQKKNIQFAVSKWNYNYIQDLSNLLQKYKTTIESLAQYYVRCIHIYLKKIARYKNKKYMHICSLIFLIVLKYYCNIN
jgi:hypothetical protein